LVVAEEKKEAAGVVKDSTGIEMKEVQLHWLN